jgi:hypothetical protein
MPVLIMISRDGRETALPIEKQRVRIGREPDCEIHLDDPSVSRHHVVLKRVYNEYFLEDQRSTNGTSLNGRRVFKHMLKHGDILDVGRFRFRYELEDKPESLGVDSDLEETIFLDKDGNPLVASEASPSEEREAQVVPGPEPEPGCPTASLRILSGKREGRRVVLDKPVLAIGPKGARAAAVVLKGGQYSLMRLGQRGETPLVNGEPIPRGGLLLKDGDVIEVSGRKIAFVCKG